LQEGSLGLLGRTSRWGMSCWRCRGLEGRAMNGIPRSGMAEPTHVEPSVGTQVVGGASVRQIGVGWSTADEGEAIACGESGARHPSPTRLGQGSGGRPFEVGKSEGGGGKTKCIPSGLALLDRMMCPGLGGLSGKACVGVDWKTDVGCASKLWGTWNGTSGEIPWHGLDGCAYSCPKLQAPRRPHCSAVRVSRQTRLFCLSCSTEGPTRGRQRSRPRLEMGCVSVSALTRVRDCRLPLLRFRHPLERAPNQVVGFSTE
jgi:hypothetical protein